MITFIQDDSLDVQMKVLASSNLRQSIESGWKKSKQKKAKDFVRENIIAAILNSSPLVQKQYLDMIETIISYDFPKKLPHLSEQLKQLLALPDINKAFFGIHLLRFIINTSYHQTAPELDALLEELIPPIITHIQTILTTPHFSNPIEGQFLKDFAKSMKKAISHTLRSLFATPDRMKGFIGIMMQTIQLDIPETEIVSSSSLHFLSSFSSLFPLNPNSSLLVSLSLSLSPVMLF